MRRRDQVRRTPFVLSVLDVGAALLLLLVSRSHRTWTDACFVLLICSTRAATRPPPHHSHRATDSHLVLINRSEPAQLPTPRIAAANHLDPDTTHRAQRSSHAGRPFAHRSVRRDRFLPLDFLPQRNSSPTRRLDRRPGGLAALLYSLPTWLDGNETRLRRRRMRSLYRRDPVGAPADGGNAAPRHQRLSRAAPLRRGQACQSRFAFSRSVFRAPD